MFPLRRSVDDAPTPLAALIARRSIYSKLGHISRRQVLRPTMTKNASNMREVVFTEGRPDQIQIAIQLVSMLSAIELVLDHENPFVCGANYENVYMPPLTSDFGIHHVSLRYLQG